MRGQIWEFESPAAAGGGSLTLLVVQADALRDAPTVIGLVVTDHPQAAGPPLVLAATGTEGIAPNSRIKTTQVRTVARAAARRRLGDVSDDVMASVDGALTEVLGLDAGSAPAKA